MSMLVKRPKGSRSLAATLAIAFLTLSVAVLFIASSIEVFFNFRTQRQMIASEQQLIAQEAANAVASFIQEKFGVLETTVKLENLASTSAAERKKALEDVLGLDRAFRQLILLDSQNQDLVKVSRVSQAAAEQLMERLEPDLFSQVGQGNRYISLVYIDELTGEPMVVMAVPATDKFGEFQGMLLAEVNLKFMWDLVERLEIGKAGRAYVVDRNGDLIAFYDIARVLRGENVAYLKEVAEYISNPMLVDETGASIARGIEGTIIVGTYVPLGTPDWAVVTELPISEAYEEVILGIGISVLVMLLVAILTGLIGVYMARRLAVPLRNLTATATQIAEGELELEAPVEGPTEVIRLAGAFN
ncbi:MAG: cache and HAMP domain-containing protein, partial [Anaerolineae bacterium]|nr:cache and HAMP domain-containing protein [Anaerolineae bacterium]